MIVSPSRYRPIRDSPRRWTSPNGGFDRQDERSRLNESRWMRELAVHLEKLRRDLYMRGMTRFLDDVREKLPGAPAEPVPHRVSGRLGGAPERCDRRRDAVARGAVDCRRRADARAGLLDPRREGRRARGELARRIGRAIAPDLSAHPRARRGEEAAGPRLRRGRGGVGRLHDRLRGRRDLRRPVLDRRFDRRRLREFRLRPPDRAVRHRAARPHRRRQQGDARPVPAGKSEGRRAPEAASGPHPRGLRRPRPRSAAGRDSRPRMASFSRARSGSAQKPSNSASSTASAISERCCASASATRSGCGFVLAVAADPAGAPSPPPRPRPGIDAAPPGAA